MNRRVLVLSSSNLPVNFQEVRLEMTHMRLSSMMETRPVEDRSHVSEAHTQITRRQKFHRGCIADL